jgi:hypothetical protein
VIVVHVDPYYNASAQFLPGKWFAPRPTTSVAMPVELYQRMPQLPTLCSTFQRIPRIFAPEAIAEREGRRLSMGRQVDRAPVREILLSGARPCAGSHDVQIRRLDPLDDEQHESLGADVSVADWNSWSTSRSGSRAKPSSRM